MGKARISNTEVLQALSLDTDIATALVSKETTTYNTAKNRFIDALVNKIVFQVVESPNFTNPFEKYDSFPVDYGETIENVYTRPTKGYKFNPDATNPFAKNKPSVVTLYGTINYEMQYKITIEDAMLRRAALNEYGFMNLINKIIGTLPNSMRLDHYFATLRMLNNSELYANGFEDLKVGETPTEEEIGKIATHKIVDVVQGFGLPKTDNNPLGELTITPRENCLLVIKKDLYNTINLDYLSGVYNLSKIDLINNIIVVDTFQTYVDTSGGASTELQGEDIDFVVLDTRGFDMHQALQDGGMLYNPEGKYTNHYLNSWKIIAFKYYFNARAFKISKTSIS